MNIFLITFRFAFFLWLGMTLVAPNLHGIVLCIDNSGNIAIEPAHQEHGCCQDHERPDAPKKHSSAIFLSVADGHGCSDCIDLPLSTDDISILIKNTSRNGLVKVKPMMAVDDMSAVMNRRDLRGARVAPHYDQPPGRSSLLVMQKITVLRV